MIDLELLNSEKLWTKLGNHPEMIRLMSKIGEAISEGGSFDKGGNAPQIPAVDVMYDNKSS